MLFRFHAGTGFLRFWKGFFRLIALYWCSLLFRQITDKYKKEAYYDFEEIPDGIKAKLKEIISKTVVKILKVKKIHFESDTELDVEVVYGLDGAGKNTK